MLHTASAGIVRDVWAIAYVRGAEYALPCCAVMDVKRRRVDTRATVFAVQRSGRDGGLVEPATMRLPAVAIEPRHIPSGRDGRPSC